MGVKPAVAHKSYWNDSFAAAPRPALQHDIETEVLVIGAGIVGLTAALLVAREGRKVVVIDMYRIGSGTTGHTTGKITAGHSLIYSQLAARHDTRTAEA
jgi:glycine/D-amino acid oxidase-like deaminating enzyme